MSNGKKLSYYVRLTQNKPQPETTNDFIAYGYEDVTRPQNVIITSRKSGTYKPKPILENRHE